MSGKNVLPRGKFKVPSGGIIKHLPTERMEVCVYDITDAEPDDLRTPADIIRDYGEQRIAEFIRDCKTD